MSTIYHRVNCTSFRQLFQKCWSEERLPRICDGTRVDVDMWSECCVFSVAVYRQLCPEKGGNPPREGQALPPQSLTWNMKMMWFPIRESPFPLVDFQVNHVKLQGCIFIFASLLKEHELVFGCRWNLITTCLPIVQHCHGNVHHLQIYLCVCVILFVGRGWRMRNFHGSPA